MVENACGRLAQWFISREIVNANPHYRHARWRDDAVRDDDDEAVRDDDVVRDDDAEQTLTPAFPLLLPLASGPALAGLVKNLHGGLASSCCRAE